jgi:hypothetical protein
VGTHLNDVVTYQKKNIEIARTLLDLWVAEFGRAEPKTVV